MALETSASYEVAGPQEGLKIRGPGARSNVVGIIYIPS